MLSGKKNKHKGAHITGRTHLQQQSTVTKGESRLTLDVSRLPAGTYFVRVENGDKLGVQKLVVIR